MEITRQIYEAIISHCGDIKNVKGVSEQSLKYMRDGKSFPTVPYLKKLFETNGMKAEITLTVKNKGIGKTKIKL